MAKGKAVARYYGMGRSIKLSERDRVLWTKSFYSSLLKSDMNPKTRNDLFFIPKSQPKPHIGSKKRHTPTRNFRPAPPAPFSSWMEYALCNLDTWSIHDDMAWEQPYPWDVSRTHIEKAILEEYLTLCEAAGVELSEESLDRLKQRFD